MLAALTRSVANLCTAVEHIGSTALLSRAANRPAAHVAVRPHPLTVCVKEYVSEFSRHYSFVDAECRCDFLAVPFHDIECQLHNLFASEIAPQLGS